MASSSSGSSIAAPGTLICQYNNQIVFLFLISTLSDREILTVWCTEAVQVLVSLLADESPNVREASIASLKDIAALYFPFLLLHLSNWDTFIYILIIQSQLQLQEPSFSARLLLGHFTRRTTGNLHFFWSNFLAFKLRICFYIFSIGMAVSALW